MENTYISLIAAIGAKTRAIGRKNDLLWNIPADMARFRILTKGHVIIMGRRTFDSIGKALPERTNIVITENLFWQREGVVVAHTLADALQKAKEIEREEIFIIGGAQIYAQASPFASRLYLTLVEDDAVGDTFFPPYDMFSKTIAREEGEWNGLRYTFLTLEK